MKELCRTYLKNPVCWLLLAGFLVRVFGISFGLPHHLIGDEEAEIFGALKMLELKTLLPVFYSAEFQGLLYYPPFLCYIYLILFLPVLALQYLGVGFPSLVLFKHQLLFDSTWLWYTARFSGLLFGLANVYLVYRLARFLFKDQGAAIAAAGFFNFSFLVVTLSHTSRHWMAGLFFSLLGIVLAIESAERHSRRQLIIAGLLFGVSFGISYLVFYFPVILILLWQQSDKNYRLLLRQLVYFLVPFAVVSVLALALYPQPFVQQIFLHRVGDSEGVKTVGRFAVFYLRALWNYEAPLFVFGLIGTALLWYKRRSAALFLTVIYIFLAAIIYIYFWNIPRYLIPLVPFIACAAGYGFSQVYAFIKGYSRYAAYALLFVLVLYTAVLFGRYNGLLLKGDTRLAAIHWLESTVLEGDSVLIYSERVRPVPTPTAAREQEVISPESLRSRERSVLLSPPPVIDEPQLRAYNLFYVTNPKQKDLLIEVARRNATQVYVVVDSWAIPDQNIRALLATSELITVIYGSDAVAGSLIPEGGGGSFIAGESHTLPNPLLKALWQIPQFGPDVMIYKLK